MTIGIAALAENSKKLVVASDQMITSPVAGMSYEWESTDIHKTLSIPNINGVILMAGNESNARMIINASLKSIKSNNLKSMEDIIKVVREEYVNFRINNFIQSVLEPRGIKNFQAYYELHAKLEKDLRNFIDNGLAQWSGCCDLIVAGKDDGDVFHIYSISNPIGIQTDHDLQGFVCIGTGGPHAMYHMIGSGYRKNMSEADVKAIVLEAKKKSEVAPGVGKLTEDKALS